MNKNQKEKVARQPFSEGDLYEFCRTRKDANSFAITLGEALQDADRAERMGDASDTAFELAFLDGTLFLDSDDLYDMRIRSESDLYAVTRFLQYEEDLDANLSLCEEGQGRRFFVIAYRYKVEGVDLSAWKLNWKDWN